MYLSIMADTSMCMLWNIDPSWSKWGLWNDRDVATCQGKTEYRSIISLQ